ncbi:uncharacterized protein MKK02DRAFT_29760 [Dioszegia hungarica]|uniref:Uncharacterized protein n=1 Tax=Dioszegia hungarica TaxID=4972 RepID=A0AA38LXI4_9TREE|nr:uncharacterized protein MKK02DRAFT_29760 [Dioszegia hungarica]KAI9639777.1 hypothetical protein MKK02DRAFT_29760 [Dioszegia hungarica]
MSSTTSTYPRPGTPFPFSHPAPPPLSHRRSSATQPPLHFAVPTLPSRTPPSLLKRSGSTSTSSSGSAPKYARYTPSSPQLPQTPTLSGRRSSASSSCSSSSSSSRSPVLSTPVLHPHNPNLEVDVEILLDTPTVYESPSESPFARKYPLAGRPKLSRGAAVPLPPSTGAAFVRPKLTRRDTPRPKAEMQMSGLEDQRGRTQRQGSYTSLVDGGKWVVV